MTRPLAAAALAALVVVCVGRLWDALSWVEVAGLAVVAGVLAAGYGAWRERG